MIQTSQAWKDYAQNNSIFHIKAVLTATDGTTFNLTDEDFAMGSVTIEDSISGDNSFNIGSVVTNKFSCTLFNEDYKFDDFNFNGATISVQFGIIYEDETEEWINRGVYTVEQPDSLGSTIQLEAYDLMDKMNTYYIGKTISSREISDTNLFDSSSAILGYWLNNNGVSVTSNENGYYSDYISVTDGVTYAVGATYGNVFCYDSSKTFLGIANLFNINNLGLVFTASVEGQTVSYIRKNGFINEIENDFVKELLGGFSDITFPISAKNLVKALADYCGVPLSSSYWETTARTINEFEYDETTSCRQVLGWILQIHGLYGRMNEDGELVCKTFNADVWEQIFSNYEEKFSPWGKNLLDSAQIYYNYAVSGYTGNQVQNNSTFATGYISVSSGETYYYSGIATATEYATVVYYNSSHTYLGYTSLNQGIGLYSFQVDRTNATYMRLTFSNYYCGEAVLCKDGVKGCFIDGGVFNVWTDPAVYVDGGTFMEDGTIEFSSVMSSTVSLHDIAITGICAYANTDSNESNYAMVGTDGYMLSLSDNALITENNMSSIASSVYSKFQYLKFRIFNASIIGSPDIEAGDSCIVTDYRGRVYPSFITNLVYTLNGITEVSANAETPEGNSLELANPSTQVMSGAVTTAVSIANSYTDTEVQEAKDYTDTQFNQIVDYVVERGTSNGWKYVKWNSGNVSAIKMKTITGNNNTGILVTTTSELNALFGVNNVNGSNTFLSLQNANAAKSGVHVESASFDNYNSWYVVLNTALTGNMDITMMANYFA